MSNKPRCPYCDRVQANAALKQCKINLKELKKRFGEDSPITRGYKSAVKDFAKYLR